MNIPVFRHRYALALLLAAGCATPNQDETVTPRAGGNLQDVVYNLDWASGTIPAGVLVAPENLKALPGWDNASGGNGLLGAQFWKSNNPEAICSEGWLMTNGANAAQRGGQTTPLTGPVSLYLSHLNFMGAINSQGVRTTNRDLYIHIIASNPGSGTLSITGKGTMPANNLWRYRETDPSRKSAWYLCSENWTNNTLTNVSKSVGSQQAVEIARVLLPAQVSGMPVSTTEGRYELNVSGGSAYFTAVATFDGSLSRAIAFASGSTAQRALGNEGSPLITPTPDAGSNYGREAGIAQYSAYFSGDVNLTLPTGAGYMGLCYNTNDRQPVYNGSTVYYQDQSALHFVRLQSSSRTWAGYGHKYNAKLVLRNPTATQKNVRISIGANPIKASISPDGNSNNVVFDGPVQTVLTRNGTTTPDAPVLHQVTLFNNRDANNNLISNPRGPQRRELRTIQVPGNGTVTLNVICYIPGLGFGAGQQLVLESGI